VRASKPRSDGATTSSLSALRAPLIAALVLSVAVVAGLASPPTGGEPVILIDRLSSTITYALSGIGGRVLLLYAFLLGAATVFNPCGFGLLPAYLGLYLAVDDSRPNARARVRRSLTVSVAVAASFAVLFGVTGAIFSFAANWIVRSLPWVGVAVGVVLVIVGATILTGRPLLFSAPEQIADKMGGWVGGSGVRAYTAFGVAYALVSLGCSFPLFFALVGAAMAAGSVGTAIAAFALFGAGMASVLAILTVIAGTLSFEVLRRGRRVTRVMTRIGAVLVLLSGGYVVFYWLSAGRVLLA
jgi:cytochrome c-type biogenesis protein